MSPLNSAEGSLTAIQLREEEGSLPIESIQRTKGRRVKVRSKAMMVGSERKEEKEEKDRTMELNKEEEEVEVEEEEEDHVGAEDSPETSLSIAGVVLR